MSRARGAARVLLGARYAIEPSVGACEARSCDVDADTSVINEGRFGALGLLRRKRTRHLNMHGISSKLPVHAYHILVVPQGSTVERLDLLSDTILD